MLLSIFSDGKIHIINCFQGHIQVATTKAVRKFLSQKLSFLEKSVTFKGEKGFLKIFCQRAKVKEDIHLFTLFCLLFNKQILLAHINYVLGKWTTSGVCFRKVLLICSFLFCSYLSQVVKR